MSILKKHKKRLEKLYWKNDQKLKFYTYTDLKWMRKHNPEALDCEDIMCGDYYCFFIQTLSYVDKEYWANTPYIQTLDGYIVITVKKFGALTDKDIAKAIKRYLKYVGCDWCFNKYWNGKLI